MLPGRTLRRPGFSLLELVVILAVLLLLFGLFLSFMFSVRAQADRTTGLSNLKNLTLAAIQHADQFALLPPIAGRGGSGIDGSILFHILPYIEQIPVHRQGPVWSAGTMNLRIPTYLDPRDKSAGPDNIFEGWLATTNYAGNWLVFKTGDQRFPASIPDGTSNTFAFTERFQVCNHHPCAWGYDRLYYWAPVFAYYSQGKFQMTPAAGECDPALPQALDRSGINVAMCDGSARLVGPSVSPQTWYFTCTPDGGEIAQPDFND